MIAVPVTKGLGGCIQSKLQIRGIVRSSVVFMYSIPLFQTISTACTFSDAWTRETEWRRWYHTMHKDGSPWHTLLSVSDVK